MSKLYFTISFWSNPQIWIMRIIYYLPLPLWCSFKQVKRSFRFPCLHPRCCSRQINLHILQRNLAALAPFVPPFPSLAAIASSCNQSAFLDWLHGQLLLQRSRTLESSSRCFPWTSLCSDLASGMWCLLFEAAGRFSESQGTDLLPSWTCLPRFELDRAVVSLSFLCAAFPAFSSLWAWLCSFCPCWSWAGWGMGWWRHLWLGTCGTERFRSCCRCQAIRSAAAIECYCQFSVSDCEVPSIALNTRLCSLSFGLLARDESAGRSLACQVVISSQYM